MATTAVTPQDKDPPQSARSRHWQNGPGIPRDDPTELARMLKLTSGRDISNNSIHQIHIEDYDTIDDCIDELSIKFDADDELDLDSDGDMDRGDGIDEIFEEIKERVSNLECTESVASHLSISTTSSEGPVVRISDHFTSIPYGIQPKTVYEHGKKNADIMGVSYNGRMRQFIILDAKGVTTWKRDAVDTRVCRALAYPKYEYKLITHLVYARKHNCYFALAKDFSLKVLNRDFVETCSVSADLSSVLFMLFNPVRDELITGGVAGTKVWHFHQVASNFMELKPLANFKLTLRYELPNIGGSWVKRVDIDQHLEHLYCCSDTDLHVYDMQGRLLFKFTRAHNMTITGCRYSIAAKVLVTASVDTEVKVWSLTGGLVHSFRGHSRAVTHLLIHPDNSSLVITSSLDGTVRMWSLETMEALYSLVVSSDGVLWMGLTDDNLLYLSTVRNISVWSLNYFYQFWSLARNRVNNLSLVGCDGKTTRVVATGDDSSVRLFARSNQKNMSTVLPPPSISPLQSVLSVCYSREFSVVFMLVNPKEIWVYTTRTDPACRIAVWNIHKIQYIHMMNRARQEQENSLSARPSSSSSALHGGQASHRATENGIGNEEITNCCCMCYLHASAMMWTDEGFCCPVRHSYLLLGLEDGRVLFMDPVVKGQKYMEFKASKDAIERMEHNREDNCLITLCSLKELIQIQVWNLPSLTLMHEVYCDRDLTHYARINMSFLTGHTSGCVNYYPLVPAEDVGMFKAKAVPEYSEAVDVHKRPEHNEAVIALDACHAMKIFCSCSDEGAIKIWDEYRVLLTEIMLDDSLSAACFLNSTGDLVVGFKKHMFFIDHTKVCPHLKPLEYEEDTFDKESFVYEDPAVMYEGVMSNPDPIDLDNYLVPYEIEFSKDFLEGKLQLDPMKVKKEETSEDESDFSMAPTEIYKSPPDTPKPLSDLDLTLGSEVTKYDLVKYMEKTLKILIEKANAPMYVRRTPKSRPSTMSGGSMKDGKKRKRRRKKQEVNVGFSEEETETEMEDDKTAGETTPFDFPAFGTSPGPTPSPSTPSTPASLSSVEVSEDGESDEDVVPKQTIKKKQEAKLQALVMSRLAELKPPPPPPKKTPVKKPPKDAWTLMMESFAAPKKTREDQTKALVAEPVLSKKEKKEVEGLKFEPSKTFSLSETKVDIKSLLKKKRQDMQQHKKEADHSHVKPQGEPDRTKEKAKREVVKKKAPAVRKLPKRGQKSVQPVTAVEKQGVDGTEINTEPPKEEEIQNQNEEAMTEEMQQHEIPTATVDDDFINENNTDQNYAKGENQIKGEQFSVERIVPGLPSVPDLTEKKETPKRVESENKKRNLTFIGAPSTSQSGETTHAGLSKEELENLEQTGQSLLQVHGRVGESDSGLESEFISASQRGMPLTETEMSEGEEMADQTSQLLTRVEMKKVKQRPASSFLDRAEHTQESQSKKTRPHTAAIDRFTNEDLQAAFNATLQKYQSMQGGAISSDKLYRNDGVQFDDNWQDRAIERHMLLRMQKEIRQYKAAQRRHLLEQRQRERQQSLFGHSDCAFSTAEAPRPVTSSYVLQQLERANTTVPMRSPTSVSPLPLKQRPQTAHMGALSRQTQSRKERSDRTEAGTETPFRLRMSPVPPTLRSRAWSEKKESAEAGRRIDPQLLDPRNPQALRPKSSRSIPSKCSRYILVSRPKDRGQPPIPSPLEEQLLFERFPNIGMKTLNTFDGTIIRHRKPTYGVEYSPYAAQMH